MADYRIKGIDAQGVIRNLAVSALTEAEARSLALAQGVQAIELHRHEAERQAAFHSFELELFVHELLTLLLAGLSLIEALEALSERQLPDSSPLPGLIRLLREGLSFSDALRHFPGYFPDLFVASMAASEQTGEMTDALHRFLKHQEQISLLRNRLVSASVYPALLMVVGGAVSLFLLGYLVPRFSQVYESLDTELPLASRLLMQWGKFAADHVLAVACSVAAMVAGMVVIFRRPEVRQSLMSWLQENRWIGGQVRLMLLSRFYRSMGLLLRGGIPVLKALHMTRNLLPGRFQTGFSRVIEAVSTGQSLSQGLLAGGLTTPVALRLLRAGEQNGQLADMLERTAAFHDEEVGRWLDRFARLFEPILMLVIGLVIGGIVILLYLPIFELAGSIS